MHTGPVSQPRTVSVPANPGVENEDAAVSGSDVVVVVDGAGLPADLRAGCHHSVAWFASTVARVLHTHLVSRASSMKTALATTIEEVRDSHAATCDLDRGSPSATVAAWRISDNQLEHLVLCDASILLAHADGQVRDIADDRLARVVAGSFTRSDRRQAVEAARNRPGGFWCVHTEPAAAKQALQGVTNLADLVGAVACSDGASRAYDLLKVQTVEEFAALALGSDVAAAARRVRAGELEQATSLREQGLKVHDDLTLVVQRFGGFCGHE